MNVNYINPFISSVLKNLEVMAGIQAERMELALEKELKLNADISGVIGLGGEISGSAIISFPKEIALAVASAMLMEELSEINADVRDAIGEFTNIVVGNARNEIVNSGYNVTISTPTIIVGKDHNITHPQKIPFIIVPFKTRLGIFNINIGIKSEK